MALHQLFSSCDLIAGSNTYEQDSAVEPQKDTMRHKEDIMGKPGIGIFSAFCFAFLLCGTAFSESQDYKLVDGWGSSGSADGQFLQPIGIAIDGDDNVFISDPMNHRIQKFTPGGELLAMWGTYGRDQGQFIAPQGIDVDGDGNVYVADFLNDRIQKFTPEGEFLAAWSTRMNGWWLYSTPRALAVDRDESCVYVHHASLTPPDLYYTCIQKFTADGMFMDQWPFIWLDSLEMAIDSNHNLYAPATIIGPVQIFNADGDLVDQMQTCPPDDAFCTTTGIALDKDGNVYVSDALHHTIKKFTPDGALITSIALEGEDGFGVRPSPCGLAIDGEGNIYVADAANDCIKKYSPVSSTTTTVPGCPVVILYGEKSRKTEALRLFRDGVLKTTPEGRRLAELYYRLSPLITRTLEEDTELQSKLRALLDSLLGSLGIRQERPLAANIFRYRIQQT
jgi:DNA-binding beta-propeller fold protein YncE